MDEFEDDPFAELTSTKPFPPLVLLQIPAVLELIKYSLLLLKRQSQIFGAHEKSTEENDECRQATDDVVLTVDKLSNCVDSMVACLYQLDGEFQVEVEKILLLVQQVIEKSFLARNIQENSKEGADEKKFFHLLTDKIKLSVENIKKIK
jgi:hypothetical protein